MDEQNQQQDNKFGGSINPPGPTNYPEFQPIFFFDGKFRTWREVQTRAGLNNAIASQIPAYRLTPAA